GASTAVASWETTPVKWIDSPAPEPEGPTNLDLLRANKQFAAELPRAIEEYQLQLRYHSFDLFHAASHFGAARLLPDADLGPLRAQLEEAAIKFEETSRWLSALQMMQSEQG